MTPVAGMSKQHVIWEKNDTIAAHWEWCSHMWPEEACHIWHVHVCQLTAYGRNLVRCWMICKLELPCTLCLTMSSCVFRIHQDMLASITSSSTACSLLTAVFVACHVTSDASVQLTWTLWVIGYDYLGTASDIITPTSSTYNILDLTDGSGETVFRVTVLNR